MSRPRRLDFHGAIHLVHVWGEKGFNIYFDASVLSRPAAERWNGVPRLLRFLKLLDECCSEYGAQLFGYCIEPNAASMLMRTTSVPLTTCIQRLSGSYSRYLHKEQAVPKHMRPFAKRYEAKVVAPEYLPHALRRVHAYALRSGLARRAVDYPFSSAPAYVGAYARARLKTDTVWQALERKGLFGLKDYRDFMEKAETPYVTALFERGSPLDARVVGGRVFVAQVKNALRHPPAPATREELIERVATLLGTKAEALYSVDHHAVLGRALVAWYALHSRAASLREVGTWFDVTGATLTKGIRHHRRLSPELFNGKSLPRIHSVDVEDDD